MSEQDDKYEPNYLRSARLSAFVLVVLVVVYPEALPFEVFGAPFWGGGFRLTDTFVTCLPLLGWGFAINCYLQANRMMEVRSPIGQYVEDFDRTRSELVTEGAILSIVAGVLEEMAFRWVIFLCAIPLLVGADWLFGGFAGIHAIEWIYTAILFPVANFMTLEVLSPVFEMDWGIGAGMLAANAFFRDGHKYQGSFGMVNSWFIGMYMFHILFTYGLPECMFAHFAYNFGNHLTVALMKPLRGV